MSDDPKDVEVRHTRNNYNIEMAKKYKRLLLLGLNARQIADCLDITPDLLGKWRRKYPDFNQAYIDGTSMADAKVARSLFKSANGFKCKAVDFRVVDGQVVQTEYIKHYPPSDKAAIFWLRNRQPALWKDRPEQDGDSDSQISAVVNLIRQQATDDNG